MHRRSVSDRPAATGRPVRVPTWARPGAVLLLALAAACGEGGSGAEARATETAEPQGSRAAELEVLDLVTAVTPLGPTASAGEENDWHTRRRETLGRLRAAGPEVGREALRLYGERGDAVVEVRCGLLDVAAHAAPEEAREVLVALVETFGDEMGVRTTAAQLLGATSPARAVEVLEPILRGRRTGRTYPPVDRLLESWFEAVTRLGNDPVPLLCEVATDMGQEIGARNFATKRLGEYDSEQGHQALEQLLVESSGNHMIRRFAAQSLQKTLEPEVFCALLKRILDREADLAFQTFLDNLLVANCR